MLRRFLLSKVHRATVTGANADYEGSLEVDADILEAAGMSPGEIVSVFNITNGERFETYLIAGSKGSRQVVLNGAAARKGLPGDRLIVITYCYAEGPPVGRYIVLDENNEIVSRR